MEEIAQAVANTLPGGGGLMEKFRGELGELKAIVSKLGYKGQWDDANDKKVYRSDDGAILNWWPSTGSLQTQGPKGPKTELEKAVDQALSANPEAPIISEPLEKAAAEESTKVFVVYGHDGAACDQLELVIRRLKLDPFVLGNTSGGGLTIIEALEKEILSPSKGKRFGIVLLTPDDMGYEQEEGPDNAEPRARQNVVMEMGMLIAAFGRNRVAILKKGHVVVPSDANGIIYLGFNNHVKETALKLCQRLQDAGFELSAAAISQAST